MTSGNRGAKRPLSDPDKHVVKGGAEIDVVQLGDLRVKRTAIPAGWRYSETMGAPRCYDTHVGYMLAGQLVVELSDGTRLELSAGDAFMIPAGHDAAVIGDEPVVMVQFDEGESAARRFNVPALEKAA